MKKLSEVSFDRDIPFPESNLVIYRDAYAIEQWLRRIAYAAVLARHGKTWLGILPPELYKELRSRLAGIDGRLYLDCENSDNAIWLLTLDELRQLLTMEPVWPTVRSLTGYTRDILSAKINELREIRNVVAHHRAVTQSTFAIWQGISASLKTGIATFKSKLLYSRDHQIFLDNENENNAAAYFRWKTKKNDWRRFQPMLSGSEYFYSLTHLPVRPLGRFVRVSSVLDAYRTIEQVILAILINMSGDEFTVTWPVIVSSEDHRSIIDRFMDFSESVWTNTDYSDQSPKYVCHPLVWFYENREPLPE